jgi:hypothetical protein
MLECQMLQLHVWDLRTQVEAQLRRLTGVQQMIDSMSDADGERDAQKQRINQHLAEILKANAAIADVSNAALEVAQLL